MDPADAGQQRTLRTMEPYPAAASQAGVWLGAMQTMRTGLLHTLGRIERAGFGQEFLDWQGVGGNDNSVGSLLYHIASVELGWLYFDIQLGAAPPDLDELMPVPGWDEQQRLSHVPGRSLQQHMELLAEARRRYLEHVSAMDPDDWRRPRSPEGEDYSVTPEWVTFHLVEHEAGHTYEIHRMVRKWRARS